MKTEFRTLNADEIECRVGTCTDKGFSLLLYKDARVDMNLLDETVGSMNWKREHQVVNGNLYCTVSIWDEEKKEWITKQDVGTESNTEAVKGEASDAFKRACFNVGIGRELYTAPFIWCTYLNGEQIQRNGKTTLSPSVKLYVDEIGYNKKREINKLRIKDKHGIVRFELGKKVEIEFEPSKKSEKSEKSDTLLIALQEVKGASTIDALIAIHNNYFNLLDTKEQVEFTQHLTNRKKEIQHENTK